MIPFPLKVGDLLPRYRARLKNARNLPLDLTSAISVRFKMRLAGGLVKVDAPAAFVDRPTGEVEYLWTGTDTNTAGDFETLFEIVWPGGKQTIPASGFGRVKIEATF
jgi:hypothetical protein